jgi:hypothetical protein
VENCTIDVTGTTTTVGVNIGGNDSTISGNTFTVDAGGTAITTSSGTATLPVTVSGNTITGSSGDGVVVTAGVAKIMTNTLDNLSTAVDVDGAAPTVTIDANTITNCGVSSTTAPLPAIEVDVTGAGMVSVQNNTITSSPDDILWVEDMGGADKVYVLFNDLSGNVKGIDNDDTTGGGTVDATHNWWGAATGPAAGFNGGLVDTSGYLGAPATGVFGTSATGVASLAAKTTAGVDVAATVAVGADNPAIMGVANYASNPQDAPPHTALAGGFYDIFVCDSDVAGVPHDASEILIKIYNANITANTDAYAWSELQGAWAKCNNQGTNVFGGYLWIKVTGTTTPEITDLAGTPFVLVEPPLASLAAPTLTAPGLGATNTSLSPAFSWGAVTGATGYEFQLSDNANFVLPIVNLTGGEAALVVPFYKYVSELDYDTTYYWRVKALDVEFVDFVISNTSAWATNVFTTEEEVEPEVPVWTCPQCGLTFETREGLEAHCTSAHPPAEPPVIEPIVEVITPAETPITPAWIYAIIAVGAVLVIAVIVLIVRTRRVA